MGRMVANLAAVMVMDMEEVSDKGEGGGGG